MKVIIFLSFFSYVKIHSKNKIIEIHSVIFVKLFLFPGSRRVRSPSTVFILCTIFSHVCYHWATHITPHSYHTLNSLTAHSQFTTLSTHHHTLTIFSTHHTPSSPHSQLTTHHILNSPHSQLTILSARHTLNSPHSPFTKLLPHSHITILLPILNLPHS